MKPSTIRYYEFGSFRIDVCEKLLYCGGNPIAVPPKVFDTLLILVESHGCLVGKEELIRRVWPETHVGPRSLAQNVFLLRKILGSEPPYFIENVPKRGYRLVGPVKVVRSEGLHQPSRESALTLPGSEFGPYRLAVLPFTVLGDTWGGRKQLFAVGLADAVITKLSALDRWIVSPTSSVLKYDHAPEDLATVARELQVEYILQSRIQRSDSATRITVQLVRAQRRSLLWGQQFDCNAEDLFEIQDAVSRQVVHFLASAIEHGNRAAGLTERSAHSHAHDDFLRGRFHWAKRTEQGILRALECFQKSLRADPSYAPAYVGLADCYNVLSFYSGCEPCDVFPKAIAAAKRARQIDPSLEESAASLGFASLSFQWDWPAAERWLKRAVACAPGYSTAWHWYAEYLLVTGNVKDAIAAITRARELDPLSVAINRQLGWMLCYTRHYDRAREQIANTLELAPKDAYLHHDLGLASIHSERPTEAIHAFEAAIELAPEDPGPLAFLGYSHGRNGNITRARLILKELQDGSVHRFVSPYLQAILWIGLGEKDSAFDELDRAFRQRSNWLMYLNSDPALDPLRTDPRFARLQSRMNLSTLVLDPNLKKYPPRAGNCIRESVLDQEGRLEDAKPFLQGVSTVR